MDILISKDAPTGGCQPHDSRLQISFADQQAALEIDHRPLEAAIQSIFRDSPFTSASVSVAIVDDRTIHELNRRHLQHDWSTDVLSYVLEEDDHRLEGELVVSAETALRQATEYGWSPDHELLLYVIHGMLHLVGYRDKQESDVRAMRAAEKKYLEQLNIYQPDEGSTREASSTNQDEAQTS